MQNLKLKMDANLKAINEMQQVFERWRIIEDYDNYSVSSFGRVKNNKTGQVLKAGVSNTYYTVSLYVAGKGTTELVHRLVAKAFINNRHNKLFVDHIDNNRLNNNILNLRWVTKVQNHQNQLMRIDNTSGVKGVSFHKQRNKWHARICIDRIQINLGLFDNFEDAKKARIERANQAFGVYTNSCEK
jgi:hypothetical protein